MKMNSVAPISKESEIAFYVNVVSRGSDVIEGVSEYVSVSSSSLSAALCCSKVTHELKRADIF